MATSGVQFGRSATLFLLNETDAQDLSEFHFKFDIQAADIETPNTARIRVYNLRPELVSYAISEFSSVVLNAGYQNNSRQIFKGTVKQFRKGRERNTDNFLDIFAADSDLNYNFGVINESLAAPNTAADRFKTYADKGLGIPTDPQSLKYLGGTGGILPRGKVMFGLARAGLRDLADTAAARWSIQNGQLTIIPLAGYLPGEVVLINSATGLIGAPEATEQGITLNVLLNPNIKMGQLIQLNNQDITQTIIKEQFFPGNTDLNLIAAVDSTDDGLFRVIVIEHVGDTRGQEWYSKIICLAVDRSAPGTESRPTVLPYG